MALSLVTAPTVDPVTLAEAKAHLRVDGSDEDTLIAAYIAAALAHLDGADGILGRALARQTWDLFLDDWPATGAIQVPLPPLASVGFVKYYDTALTLTTLTAGTDYTVDTYRAPGWIVPGTAGWPAVGDTINAVQIRFTAGWADDGASPPAWAGPAAIKAALLLMVGDLYENRLGQTAGAKVEPNAAVRALLSPYHLWRF